MSISRLAGIVAGAVLLFFIAHWLRDPHRTSLPFGSTDLSSVEASLRKLPAEERALVEAYVRRSNGDVLPAKFADPDDPLTARTFGEAITLQKRWDVKMRAQKAVADARAAERDLAMAPLRAAVTAHVAKSEVITRDEYDARMSAGATQVSASGAKIGHRNDSTRVFVVTVAIDNHSDADVIALKGSIEAKDRDAYLPLNLCWIDLGEQRSISAHSHAEIQCANRNFSAGPNERAFVDDPPGRFEVIWSPQLVKLSDGKVLQAKQ